MTHYHINESDREEVWCGYDEKRIKAKSTRADRESKVESSRVEQSREE